MADLKISQLSDGGNAQAADEFVVARSGANYRIDGASVAAAATSVGTLSSLTVSGDLTVDTSTLKVDSTNNRVGIGTASPGTALDVSGAISLQGTTLPAAGVARITSRTSDSSLYIQPATGGSITFLDGSQNTMASFGPTTLTFNTSNTSRMTLDASGNLGLGVTPSAWDTLTALQVKNAAVVGYLNRAYLQANAYFQNAVGNRYIAADFATRYTQDSGKHIWETAPSGSVGGTISFTQAMTLDASGNLGVGTTSPAVRLHLKGANNEILRLQSSDATTGSLYFAYYDSADSEKAYIGYGSGATDEFSFVQRENAAMVFFTNATERARITSGGYFKASNAGTYFSSTSSVHEFRTNTSSNEITHNTHTASSSPYGVRISYTAASPNGTDNWFLYCDDSTALRAEIRSNGGLANYSANNVNLASDERLKKDIAPIASTWDKLKAIEVVNFRYKDCNDGDPALYGVIAQQVQPIVPELVVVTREAVEAKDAVLDDDGNEVKPAVEAAPEYYGIREQPMYWLAIKALQEAQDRIEALEARLEALEA
jgi:hypothetical protein